MTVGAPPDTGRNTYRRAKTKRVSNTTGGWVTDPPVGPGPDLLRALRKARREGMKVSLLVQFGELSHRRQSERLERIPGTLPLFQPGFTAELPGGAVSGPVSVDRLLRELGSDPVGALESLALTVRASDGPPASRLVAGAQGPHTIVVHARP